LTWPYEPPVGTGVVGEKISPPTPYDNHVLCQAGAEGAIHAQLLEIKEQITIDACQKKLRFLGWTRPYA